MQDKSMQIIKCNSSVCDVFDTLDIATTIRYNEIIRQVAAAFLFGFINAFAINWEISPPQVHGIMLSLLVNKFQYSNQQAVDFSLTLIEATKKVNAPTINAIIHHGIDSYYQYQSNDLDMLKKNFNNVITIITG